MNVLQRRNEQNVFCFHTYSGNEELALQILPGGRNESLCGGWSGFDGGVNLWICCWRWQLCGDALLLPG